MNDQSALAGIRVLMAVPQYPYPVVGGLERQAHELAKALVERGVKVQVLSGRTLPGQPLLETMDGITVHRIAWATNKYWRYLRSPLDVIRVMYRNRMSYDVVHLHQCSWFSLFAVFVARVLGKPALIKLSGVGVYGVPGLRQSSFGSLKLRVLRSADAVIAMSSESLGELRQVGFPMTRVLRTPNGIRIDPEIRKHAAELTMEQKCRVVYVGRVGAGKGLDDLMHVWSSLVDASAVPALLEIWGDGPLLAETRDLCARLGIDSTVVFRGHVDSVMDRLQSMDVFVLPSAGEGNSNAILEAMAVGLPVVSTRVGGTPMLVGPDGQRYLFTPGDREAFRARLLELIQDSATRRLVGTRMRDRVERYFDIRTIAATYHDAYTQLVAGQRDRIWDVGNALIADD